MWNDSDFDQASQKRNFLKTQGPEICKSEFQRLYLADRTHLPNALNYGICLLDTGEYRESESILGEFCNNGAFDKIGEVWRFDAIKFYTQAIRDRSVEAAVDFALKSLPTFGGEYRNGLLNHTTTHLADQSVFERLNTAVQEFKDDFKFTQLSVRKFYEFSSSKNALNALDTLHNSYEDVTRKERKLLSLLHDRFDLTGNSHARWSELYYELKNERVYISPFDAYRLSLQMHERLGSTDALEEIQHLISMGDDYYSCYWPLGALQEEMGDLNAARRSYSSAGSSEITRDNRPLSKIKQVNREDVKISCIALSCNDAPLIEIFCRMMKPHCDELIVNDGGSTDGTIELFQKFSREENFPIHVIRDQQALFRDRNVFKKDDYRKAGFGGVKGFEADRRRTTTLMLAQYEYIFLADLDDFFPEFPNLKTIVSANYGVDHIAGSRRELLDRNVYCDLYNHKDAALPTLFKRDRHHAFSGVNGDDEYLARLDQDLHLRASKFMDTSISKAYHFWHLKWLLDPSQKAATEPYLGVKSSVTGIHQRPDLDDIMNSIARHKK